MDVRRHALLDEGSAFVQGRRRIPYVGLLWSYRLGVWSFRWRGSYAVRSRGRGRNLPEPDLDFPSFLPSRFSSRTGGLLFKRECPQHGKSFEFPLRVYREHAAVL